MQNSVAFLYRNSEHPKSEIKEIVPFHNSTKDKIQSVREMD